MKKRYWATLIATLVSSSVVGSVISKISCEQLSETEQAPDNCRARTMTEAAHPWSGIKSPEAAKAFIENQCKPLEANRDSVRLAYFKANKRALKKLLPGFDRRTASSFEWGQIVYGTPSICQKIANAPNP